MLRRSSYNSHNLAHNLKHSSPRKSLNILEKTFSLPPKNNVENHSWKIHNRSQHQSPPLFADESKRRALASSSSSAENHYRKISLVRYRLETSLKCNFATTAGAHTHTPAPTPTEQMIVPHRARTKDRGEEGDDDTHAQPRDTPRRR